MQVAEYKAEQWTLLLSTAVQAVDYLLLVGLFAPIDNGHQRLKTVCQLLQGYQILELGYA
eukprot:SAG22_NODE_493_length_9820_cov_53.085588_10_plen_60_part_00